jgi:hypothetical protein
MTHEAGRGQGGGAASVALRVYLVALIITGVLFGGCFLLAYHVSELPITHIYITTHLLIICSPTVTSRLIEP